MHVCRWLMDRALRTIETGSLTVDYWDGGSVTYGAGLPHARLKIHRPGAVPGLLLHPDMAFGEAYMRGDIEVVGEIEDFVAVTGSEDVLPGYVDTLLRALYTAASFRPFSIGRHRRDVQRHYDLGNDFYRLWLDPTMTYSCAYFRSPDEDLETAQRRKIRHTFDKLHLQPGDSLLDIGCGWGGLVREAAQQYGARAVGITLSEEQVHWFEEQWAAECPTATVALEHYHTLAAQGERFDRIVSVGMAEHVGRRQLPGYFRAIDRLLKPGGLGLLHCITYIQEEPTNPWLLRYIFPGGYIPSLREVIHGLSSREFTIWDVENIGRHYPLTLDRWAQNFDAHEEVVRARYGEEFVRMWRLYLRFCAASFRHEDVFVHQILFSRGQPDALPLVRSDVDA